MNKEYLKRIDDCLEFISSTKQDDYTDIVISNLKTLREVYIELHPENIETATVAKHEIKEGSVLFCIRDFAKMVFGLECQLTNRNSYPVKEIDDMLWVQCDKGTWMVLDTVSHYFSEYAGRMTESPCSQCANPDLKGMHTCTKAKEIINDHEEFDYIPLAHTQERNRLAGLAMQPLLSSWSSGTITDHKLKEITTYSYKVADSMMEVADQMRKANNTGE